MELKDYEHLIGKKIKITNMQDPYAARYIGREGIVQRIAKDCCGDVQLWGTWAGVAVYPGIDSYELES